MIYVWSVLAIFIGLILLALFPEFILAFLGLLALQIGASWWMNTWHEDNKRGI